MIQVNGNIKPQCWYEESENGYQVLIRKPKGDYFRTEYIECKSKDEAKSIVREIKNNGYVYIPHEEEKPVRRESEGAKNKIFSFGDDDLINLTEKPSISEPKEEKPKAKFEFGDEDSPHHIYNKIPRYEDIPEDHIQETGTTRPLKFGNVQVGKGIL